MKVTIVCRHCKHAFEVFPCYAKKVYCSSECYKASGTRKIKRATEPNRNCAVCLKPFRVPASRQDAKFCSSECYHASTRGAPTHNKGTGKGYIITDRGYKKIKKPDHPRADKNGYVREHIVVMEEHLGRLLNPGETIHHKNKIRDDNRLENLQLFSSHSEHLKHDFPKGKPVAVKPTN